MIALNKAQLAFAAGPRERHGMHRGPRNPYGLGQSSGTSGPQAFRTNRAGSVGVAGPMRRARSSLIPAARAAAMSLSWSPMRIEPVKSRLRSRAAARINPGLGLRHSQFLSVGSADNGWWGHM